MDSREIIVGGKEIILFLTADQILPLVWVNIYVQERPQWKLTEIFYLSVTIKMLEQSHLLITELSVYYKEVEDFIFFLF